jgi:hypothetical protein
MIKDVVRIVEMDGGESIIKEVPLVDSEGDTVFLIEVVWSDGVHEVTVSYCYEYDECMTEHDHGWIITNHDHGSIWKYYEEVDPELITKLESMDGDKAEIIENRVSTVLFHEPEFHDPSMATIH